MSRCHLHQRECKAKKIIGIKSTAYGLKCHHRKNIFTNKNENYCFNYGIYLNHKNGKSYCMWVFSCLGKFFCWGETFLLLFNSGIYIIQFYKELIDKKNHLNFVFRVIDLTFFYVWKNNKYIKNYYKKLKWLYSIKN